MWNNQVWVTSPQWAQVHEEAKIGPKTVGSIGALPFELLLIPEGTQGFLVECCSLAQHGMVVLPCHQRGHLHAAVSLTVAARLDNQMIGVLSLRPLPLLGKVCHSWFL